MSQEVAVQNSNTAIAIPADLAAMFAGVKANVTAAEKVNQLRISGKVWKSEIDGKVTKIVTLVEGEEVPVPMVKVIIVAQNPKRARALFEGEFVEGEAASPTCWSSDSTKPDAEVTTPKCATCEDCPEAQKQTKFDKANPDKVIEFVPCKYNKRIAVIQHNKPASPAMRLQLAITSLWEPKDTAKTKEVQGWYAFDGYCKMLAAKGINNTAMCRTIMKFDSEVNQPKVLFKFDGLIDAEAAAILIPRINSDEVQKVIGAHKAVTENATPEPKGESGENVGAKSDDTEAKLAAEAKAKAEADEAAAVKAKAAEAKKAAKAAEAKKAADAEAAEAKAASEATKPAVEIVEAETVEEALSTAWD